MKAIKVELILKNNVDGEYFITKILPKLKEKYKMKQVHYMPIQYFGK